jgi:hypothetical protein
VRGELPHLVLVEIVDFNVGDFLPLVCLRGRHKVVGHKVGARDPALISTRCKHEGNAIETEDFLV